MSAEMLDLIGTYIVAPICYFAVATAQFLVFVSLIAILGGAFYRAFGFGISDADTQRPAGEQRD